MTKHFRKEIIALNKKVMHLTAMVEENLRLAVKAVTDRNTDLAKEVVERDYRIDQNEVELEEECLKILALHQPGAIDVVSQPAKGTTFFIYLPSTTEGGLESTSQSVLHTAGAGRILIMDDEAGVRKLAGRVLKKLGYDVDCASDGEEAIVLYKEAKRKNWPFDLIIMDLTIPGGMGGIDALAVIQQIDPEVKAIVSSGYSNDPVMANHEAYGFKACVVKPYRPNQLANVIVGVLSEE